LQAFEKKKEPPPVSGFLENFKKPTSGFPEVAIV
jgi:hypothetical protein